MKKVYVRDLEENQQVHTTFLVASKEIRQKKSGEPFLSLMLADKTGDVDSKMWDNVAEVMHTFDRDDFLKVKGVAQVFQNRIQLTIHKLQKIDDTEADFADFFPSSSRRIVRPAVAVYETFLPPIVTVCEVSTTPSS